VHRIVVSVHAEPWFVNFAEIVRRETEGHVQLLRFLLLDTWQFVRRANHVVDDKLAYALRFYLGSIGAPATISRAAVRDQPLPPEQVFVLQQLFRGKDILAPPPIDRQSPSAADPHLPLRTLLRSVVLVVRANNFVDFATLLHRRAFLRVIFPGRCSKMNTQDLNEFVCAVVGCLDSSQLQDHSSTGSQGFSKETPLQHQFFAAACMCLPPQHVISSEVSRILLPTEEVKSEGSCTA